MRVLLVCTLLALPAATAAAAVISGVTLGLGEATASRVRLRFEVCGEDVTQIPGTGFPVRFAFDTPVVYIGVHAGHPTFIPDGSSLLAFRITTLFAKDSMPFLLPRVPMYI
jgi:hypothetical protein